ncbi:hypothetical protein D3C85_1477670 [compost metagenome]
MSRSGNEIGHFKSNKHAEWAGAMAVVPTGEGIKKKDEAGLHFCGKGVAYL